MMTQLKIRQVRSAVGGRQNQRDTLRTLGLKRVGDESVARGPAGGSRHDQDGCPSGGRGGGRLT